MKNGKYLFTSESVTEGHPDKVADQISDSILDAILADDPMGRVAVETLVTTGMAFVGGEISTSCYVDIPMIVRKTIQEIGYTSAHYGFDYLTCGVMTSIQRQSPDIAQGVDTGGAGDQGMMFGYATKETPELMPMPIILAHKVTRHLAHLRREGILDYLRPDGKSQITVAYHNAKPVKIDTVVISAHHAPKATLGQIKRDLIRRIVRNPKILPQRMIDKNTKIFINPTGRFEVGGPQADTGLTGRKIIADTYGGVGSHGGGAYSGKDPSKVDRSASYMARYVAKNIVAANIAKQCEIQIAYAIGVAEPVSVMVNHDGTGRVSNERLNRAIRKVFDLTPKSIIETLQLRRPIYRLTAAYGHFGRNEDVFTWEKTDRVRELKQCLKRR